MKTRLIVALLAAALFLAGCSERGGSAEVEIDPAEAANKILEEVPFRDSLVAAEAGAAEDYYALDDTVAGYAIYISGSGATAEEVAVLTVSKSEDISAAEAILEKRLGDLVFRFEAYRPDEMQKLENPVLETAGNAVIMVLSDDNEAARNAIEAIRKQK